MPPSPGFGTICAGRKLADPSARWAPLSESGPAGVSRLGRARASFFRGARLLGALQGPRTGMRCSQRRLSAGGAAKTWEYRVWPGQVRTTGYASTTNFPNSAPGIRDRCAILPPGHACGGWPPPSAGGGRGLGVIESGTSVPLGWYVHARIFLPLVPGPFPSRRATCRGCPRRRILCWVQPVDGGADGKPEASRISNQIAVLRQVPGAAPFPARLASAATGSFSAARAPESGVVQATTLRACLRRASGSSISQ